MKYADYPKPELMEKVIDYVGAHVRPIQGWQSVHCFNSMAHSQNDKRASASINISIGRYKCHACDLSGDGWDIMKTVYDMGFKQAAQALGIEAGYTPVPEEETWITWR